MNKRDRFNWQIYILIIFPEYQSIECADKFDDKFDPSYSYHSDYKYICTACTQKYTHPWKCPRTKLPIFSFERA